MGFNGWGYGSVSVGFGSPGNELQQDGEWIKVSGNSPCKAVHQVCVLSQLKNAGWGLNQPILGLEKEQSGTVL